MKEPEEMLEQKNKDKLMLYRLVGSVNLYEYIGLFEVEIKRSWLWRFNLDKTYIVEGFIVL